MQSDNTIKKYTPVIPLSEFIDYFYIDSAPEKQEWLKDFIIPTHPRIIFNLSDNKGIPQANSSHVKGICSLPCNTNLPTSKTVVIGARFKPYGLYSGFGINGDAVSENIVPASVLFSGHADVFTTDEIESGDENAIINSFHQKMYAILKPKDILYEITEMIDALVSCDLTNDSQKHLAKAFAKSPKSFIAIFKKATGFTPLKYLHIHKVEQAKSLLVQPGIPMAEIAFLLGFYDHPHFIRIFKLHTGLTPAGFRKRYCQ